MKRIALIGLAVLLGTGMASGFAVTSQLGYHPNSYKHVIVYTDNTSGMFDIRNGTGNIVYSDGLVPTTCQGGQPCLVGQFSNVTDQGTYHINTSTGATTDTFQISNDTFQEHEAAFLEFFEANKQVNSSYHKDLHKAQDPYFPMQADGSFINEAWMSSSTLIRLGSAYQANPDFFTTDKYTTVQDGELDILEHIRHYTEYLTMLQDATPDRAVSKGWNNNFLCGTADPDEEQWNDEPEDCMTFVNTTSDLHTAETLLAYTQAMPALEQQNSSYSQQILQRAENTSSYLEGKNLSGGSQAYHGAAMFQLYDYTGDEQYLQEAHDMRDSVARSIAIHNIQGNEFYWEEYVKHKADITENNLTYVVNGNEPVAFFDTSIHNYSTGEGVLEWDDNSFQSSRPMLTAALYSTKQHTMQGDTKAQIRADAQISWLTGMNSIQDGHGDGEKVRRSFIFGIGTNPDSYHSRLNPDQENFLNGIDYIPGWVSGAYDSNGDDIYNHQDDWNAWRFTESTNHMVALALENFAYMDAAYSEGTAPADRNLNGSERNTSNQTEGNETDDNGNETVVSETGLVRTTDTGLTVGFSCKPEDTSDNLVVDWNFGDGASMTDVSYVQNHTYGSEGTYLVQCDVWDNQNVKFVSEQAYIEVGDNQTEENQTENETDEQVDNETDATDNETTSETGLTRTDSTEFESTFACNPAGSSDDLVVDWSFGDGTSRTDVNPVQTHRYNSSGTYFVQCDAWDNVNAEFTSLQGYFNVPHNSSSLENQTDNETVDNSGNETVNETEDSTSIGELDLMIKQWYPQGRDYVFICENGGQEYEWSFGDGQAQLTRGDDVYHIYESAGNYTVQCSSSGETATLNITVE